MPEVDDLQIFAASGYKNIRLAAIYDSDGEKLKVVDIDGPYECTHLFRRYFNRMIIYNHISTIDEETALQLSEKLFDKIKQQSNPRLKKTLKDGWYRTEKLNLEDNELLEWINGIDQYIQEHSDEDGS
ncbi:MAG: hypothetical protein KKC05_02795 [Nanoarchaeota archaeon]|nr:hypothetical protein [Nanoarchaeota archaeon]